MFLASRGCVIWRLASRTDAVHAVKIFLHTHGELPEIEEADLRQLTRDEHERAARFVFERDRRQFLLSRVLLRNQLAEALTCAPASVRYARGVHGKPSIEGVDERRLSFNLSHTQGAVLIALGQGAIGVDIERHDARAFPAEVGESVFTNIEQTLLSELPAMRYNIGAYALWTRKEALIKADGRGFGIEPKSIRMLDGAPLDGGDPVADAWVCQHEGIKWFGRTCVVAPSWVYSIVSDEVSTRDQASMSFKTCSA